MKRWIEKRKLRKEFIKNLNPEDRIRIQIEKDKALFLILIGIVFIVVGIFNVMLFSEIVKIY